MNLDDDYYDPYTYLESSAFLDYVQKVSDVIHAAAYPVSIRTIHETLGAEAKTNWTADALEAVCNIEPVGILPTRYRPTDRRQLPAVRPFNRNLPPLTEAP